MNKFSINNTNKRHIYKSLEANVWNIAVFIFTPNSKEYEILVFIYSRIWSYNFRRWSSLFECLNVAEAIGRSELQCSLYTIPTKHLPFSVSSILYFLHLTFKVYTLYFNHSTNSIFSNKKKIGMKNTRKKAMQNLFNHLL